MTTCRERDCTNEATFRVTWPGDPDLLICAEHAPELGATLGAFGIGVEPIPTPAAAQIQLPKKKAEAGDGEANVAEPSSIAVRECAGSADGGLSASPSSPFIPRSVGDEVLVRVRVEEIYAEDQALRVYVPSFGAVTVPASCTTPATMPPPADNYLCPPGESSFRAGYAAGYERGADQDSTGFYDEDGAVATWRGQRPNEATPAFVADALKAGLEIRPTPGCEHCNGKGYHSIDGGLQWCSCTAARPAEPRTNEGMAGESRAEIIRDAAALLRFCAGMAERKRHGSAAVEAWRSAAEQVEGCAKGPWRSPMFHGPLPEPRTQEASVRATYDEAQRVGPYRVGSRLGRTIYRDDECIGMVDNDDAARFLVGAANYYLQQVAPIEARTVNAPPAPTQVQREELGEIATMLSELVADHARSEDAKDYADSAKRTAAAVLRTVRQLIASTAAPVTPRVSPTKTSAAAYRKVNAAMHQRALDYLNSQDRKDETGGDAIAVVRRMLRTSWDEGFEEACHTSGETP